TRFDHGILTIWNWHNKAIKQRRIIAGESATLEIAIVGTGTYLLTLDGYLDGVCQRRMIRNLSVTQDLNHVREAWKKDEFFFGVCAFPGRYHWKTAGEPTLPDGLTPAKAREREATLMARLGLQVVRTDESMEIGEPLANGSGDYRFNFDRMDAAVGAYTSRGFELVLQTMNAADWAVLPKYAHHGPTRWRYPHQEAPQRAYISALVKRYQDHVRFVQISNEPDQIGYWAGTNEEFVEQFLFSLDQVRQDAPKMPVTYGGFSLVDVAKCQYFLHELHEFVDLPTYNAHGDLWSYKRSFATMRRLQEEAGDTATRWINTETGYSAWRLDQERRQAQINPQKALYSWANGHAGILLFCSRMTRGPGRDGPPDFGIVDYQFSPRFTYGSIAALTSTLVGASFRETLAESETVHLYVFEREDDLVVAGFTLGDPTSIQIEHDATVANYVDEMGNPSQLAKDPMIALSLDGYPRYWVLDGASYARIVPDQTGLNE
ncbi:MAG: hypothetical protein AAF357_13930, partial [Verrucomicrobiota bacterium]